jgi:L-ascorbate metabolism protein UlaG (beta-lactamase superfamily)
MSVEIKWFGHASFRLAAPGSVVYIDPWKLRGSPHDADVVVVSHSHHDHCSAPDVAKVSKEGTTIIAPADTADGLDGASAICPTESLAVDDVTVEAIAAYNVNKSFHPKGKKWIGAVIAIGGKRIYYAGDTDLIDEMRDLGDIDVALLPIGGTYTLDALEAARACERIGCKSAIGYHWGDIVGSAADAKAFAKATSCCPVHMLAPGEKITLE